MAAVPARFDTERQIEALEEPVDAIVVDAAITVDEAVARIRSAIDGAHR